MKKLGPDQQCGDSFSIVVSRPLEVIRADILGPLPMSTTGNRYILFFTNHFTKWVEVFAIQKQTADIIAKCFLFVDIWCSSKDFN
jgi:hypothetical protein